MTNNLMTNNLMTDNMKKKQQQPCKAICSNVVLICVTFTCLQKASFYYCHGFWALQIVHFFKHDCLRIVLSKCFTDDLKRCNSERKLLYWQETSVMPIAAFIPSLLGIIPPELM